MPPMEFRDYLELLTQHGLLTRIEREVDYMLELGRVTRETQSPLLFERVKGYPDWRVFTNGLCNRSLVGIALGLPPGATRSDVARVLRDRVTSGIKPRVVAEGPVMENVQSTGIDLTKLPIPQWHPSDGGRYLGTWHINISQDPENGLRNVGVYRMELLNKRQATVSTSANSDLGIHVAKAEKAGRPLPMAVAIGVSETTMMAAGAGVAGRDEFELAGALQAEPLCLVHGKTIDLDVPASAELVIEGVIKNHERVLDGPYFDYAGKVNTNPNAFLFEATGLMYRNNPIFRGSSIGHAGAEDHQLFAALADVGLIDFHGSTLKRRMQSVLLRQRQFKGFQFVGKLGNPFR